MKRFLTPVLLITFASSLCACQQCHSDVSSPVVDVPAPTSAALLTICRNTACTTATLPDRANCCCCQSSGEVCGFCDIPVATDPYARVTILEFEADGSFALGVFWSGSATDLKDVDSYLVTVSDGDGRTLASWSGTCKAHRSCDTFDIGPDCDGTFAQ